MTETFMPYKVSALECLRETFIDRLSRRLFFALMKDFKIGKTYPGRKRSAVPVW